MAGHKGYGIGLMMDVIASALAGAKSLDISRFRPLADFESQIESMIARIKGAKRAAGTQEIFYPGEIEAAADIRNREIGLKLAVETIRDLEKEAARAGLASLLPCFPGSLRPEPTLTRVAAKVKVGGIAPSLLQPKLQAHRHRRRSPRHRR